MELSYLDYIKDSKNEVFQIDDESMIGYAVTNRCFNSKPIDRYVFSVRNREYFIFSNKDEADEVYNGIESFVKEIKSIDTSLSLESYVTGILNVVRNFIDVDAHGKYLTVLTSLINRKLRESANKNISSLYIDDINEDFVSIIEYKKSLLPKAEEDMDIALDEFYKELKELNKNLYLGREDYSVEGEDRCIVYIDAPTYLIVHRVSGFGKLVTDFYTFNTNVHSRLSDESLKELEEVGFIYISYVDDKKPSNRLLSLLKMDKNKRISIV